MDVAPHILDFRESQDKRWMDRGPGAALSRIGLKCAIKYGGETGYALLPSCL